MSKQRNEPSDGERLATGPGTTRPFIFERALARYLRIEARRGHRRPGGHREVTEDGRGRSVDVVDDDDPIGSVRR